MKLDLSKQYKAYYTAKTKPELVDIEQAHFLSVLGKGDPSGKEFAERIQALYSTAYTIKFACKAQDKDFVVAKLEAQWWYDEVKFAGVSMQDSPTKIARSEWEYRLLIRMPDYVDRHAVQLATQQEAEKKQIPYVDEIELFEIGASKAVQMLHIGPFDAERVSLKQMIAMMQAKQLLRNGPHHEVYLSDFRKTAPEKLKTILREPVKTH